MNKSSISIILLSLLMTSCGNIPTSENKSIFNETLFNKIKNGIKIQCKVYEKVNDQTEVFLMQNTMKYKAASMIKYKDDTDSEIVLKNTYLGKDEDNFVYTIHLNMNNQIYYDKDDSITWSNGYTNPFSLLNYTDFSLKNNKYTLSDAGLKKFGVKNGFSFLLYGNPGINITNVDLSVIDNNIYLSALGNANGQINNYTFEGLIIESDSKVEIDYSQSPFTGESDEDFEAMLTALRKHNYTATINNVDEKAMTNETSIFYSNKDKIFFNMKNETENIGYYTVSSGGIQEVVKDGNNYYKAGPVIEKTLDDFRSDFPISSLCFNRDKNVYTIKDKVEGVLTDLLPIEMLVPKINDFTITINENEYVFKNINGTKSSTIVFSDIGTTTIGFSEETILEPNQLGWKEILNSSFDKIAEIIGAENLEQLPVPTWYWDKEWKVNIDDGVALVMAFYETTTIEEDIENYGLQLIAAGYTKREFEDSIGPSGKIYIKECQINNETKTIAIEPFQYAGVLSIGIYIVEE